MWPFWSIDRIELHNDAFLHWCSIVGAIIGAIAMVVFLMVGSLRSEQAKDRYEPMGSLGLLFWSPFLFVLAVIVGGPIGALLGWWIVGALGVIVSTMGIPLAAVGAVTCTAVRLFQ